MGGERVVPARGDVMGEDHVARCARSCEERPSRAGEGRVASVEVRTFSGLACGTCVVPQVLSRSSHEEQHQCACWNKIVVRNKQLYLITWVIKYFLSLFVMTNTI